MSLSKKGFSYLKTRINDIDMSSKKKNRPKEKAGLHARNKHRERYDFEALTNSCPELAPFVIRNKFDDLSIDFSNPEAVLMLNKSLLKHHYGIDYWRIPKGYLCPPIPGRADYIHHIADLLGSSNHGKIPNGEKIRCLDVGAGANCIYPIIGNISYGWSFVGSDVVPAAIKSASEIVQNNPSLSENISLRLQSNRNDIFKGIINDEFFDLTICNPPFHGSAKEAAAASIRKLSNLSGQPATKVELNFGGQHNELWCAGGEEAFVQRMIAQSKIFADSCFWFSTLVSKQENLKSIYAKLEKEEAFDVKTIRMAQGNKVSRIVAWTFLNADQQQEWIKSRW